MTRNITIPAMEFTSSGSEEISRLSRRLGIEDPRELVATSLDALRILSEVAGDKGGRVLVSSETGENKKLVRLRKGDHPS